VIVNRSDFDTNVNKLDERVARSDREIRQVKDAMNENKDETKKAAKGKRSTHESKCKQTKIENRKLVCMASFRN
jgi:lipid II:glycine glycyltransferase (peptidoglycan interpeptide bridge formation enzyme)